MASVFADAGYWVAIINPHDNLHGRALAALSSLKGARVVSSEMVLVEVLNYFAEFGAHIRQVADEWIRAAIADDRYDIVPQTPELFRSAYDLYANRPDKTWSLTDCASFVIMQQRGIEEALTHDHHFEQYGFRALLRN